MSEAATPSELWQRLGSPRTALAVVAHPDDESFGLGAVIATLVEGGTTVTVLCFTHGEASTLGASSDLGTIRRAELERAAAELGVRDVFLHDYADGRLAAVDPLTLDGLVGEHADVDLLVVLEPGGVTGHPDHRAATASAVRVADRLGIPLLEWGVHGDVAAHLEAETGVPFVAMRSGPGVIDVIVDRRRQRAAIACHATQLTGNGVLPRRLELQGDRERLRYVPVAEAGRAPPSRTSGTGCSSRSGG